MYQCPHCPYTTAYGGPTAIRLHQAVSHSGRPTLTDQKE